MKFKKKENELEEIKTRRTNLRRIAILEFQQEKIKESNIEDQKILDDENTSESEKEAAQKKNR